MTDTPPRTMKQPRKETLREALRAAADRIEAIARERDSWRELAEREPQVDESATPFPALALLAIGGAIGALSTALAGWLL